MGALSIRFAEVTHKGRRSENQDNTVILMMPGEGILAAVADGMGGHQGGGVASSTALDAIGQSLFDGASIRDAVHTANQKVRERAQRSELNGMGTTVVGAHLEGDHYHVFNVGDSRAYCVTPAGTTQISLDHSFVFESLRDGSLTEEQLLTSKWKNALTRSISGETPLEVDVFGPFSAEEPHILLLCSDGLYKSVPDSLLAKVVLGTDDPKAGAKALVDVAFRRGSDDNISVVIVEFGSTSRSPDGITLPQPIEIQDSIDVSGEAVTGKGEATDRSRASTIVSPRRLAGIIGFLILAFLAVGWKLGFWRTETAPRLPTPAGISEGLLSPEPSTLGQESVGGGEGSDPGDFPDGVGNEKPDPDSLKGPGGNGGW